MPIIEINKKESQIKKDPNLIRQEMLKKEATLSAVLAHPRGLDKIAATLTNPVRMYLDYVSISRKLVVVEPIPEGQIAYFDYDIPEFYGVKVGADGTSRFIICRAERVQIDPFEIFSKAKVPFKELRIRKYRVFDRMKERLKQAMALREDLLWFSLFHSAANVYNQEIIESGNITKDGLAKAFEMVERHRLIVSGVVLSPTSVLGIRTWQRDYIDEVARIEIRRTGYLGNIFGASFYVTNMIKPVVENGNNIVYLYVVTAPEFLGWYPIYEDAAIVPADRGDDGLLGLTCYQLCGMIVHNARGVARVKTIITP